MAGEKLIPPIPYKVPVIDQRTNLITTQWGTFFRQLFYRAGGVDALSNLELEDQINTEGIESDIDDLQTDVSELQDLVNGLLVEPMP